MPETKKSRTCLVVGAGMAGLTAAAELHEKGWHVTVLDKGRGVGGRMATRRIGENRFDHGAQFFTVRDARFAGAVNCWINAGWAQPWFVESGHERFCGRQGMNALAKQLARPLVIRTEIRVETVSPVSGGWQITTSSKETFRADTLLLTPPAPQTLALLGNVIARLPPALVTSLQMIEFDPCFALMATLRDAGQIPHPGYLRPDDGLIAWIADNRQKGISPGNAVTIHARPAISRAIFNAPREEVARILLDAAAKWLGSEVTEWQLHRWKFSQPVQVCGQPCLFSELPAPLAIAGDAFGGPRVEGAFLSGLAAASALLKGGSL